MNRKLMVFPLLVIFLVFGLVSHVAQADGFGKGKGCREGLDGKVFYKVMVILKNRDELGLSDKQVERVKDLKFATKRELVNKDAEIDLVKIDIKEKLYEDKVDVPAVNALIDKKYDLKKAKAKYLLKQYTDLKSILTDEQLKKMKTLRRES